MNGDIDQSREKFLNDIENILDELEKDKWKIDPSTNAISVGLSNSERLRFREKIISLLNNVLQFFINKSNNNWVDLWEKHCFLIAINHIRSKGHEFFWASLFSLTHALINDSDRDVNYFNNIRQDMIEALNSLSSKWFEDEIKNLRD